MRQYATDTGLVGAKSGITGYMRILVLLLLLMLMLRLLLRLLMLLLRCSN
jgi:hypothetical protein